MKPNKTFSIINSIFDIAFILTALLIGLNVVEMNNFHASLFAIWGGMKIVSLISKKVYKQKQLK